MKVAIVVFPSSQKQRMLKIAEAFGRGVAKQEAEFKIFDPETDPNTRLSAFEYIVAVAEPLGYFSSKLHDRVSQILSSIGNVTGKKASAFILKKGIFNGKALRNLMSCLEHEGMVVKFSDFLSTELEADMFGQHIHLQASKK